MTMKVERLLVRVLIRDESDVVLAKNRVRDLAGREGMRNAAVEALEKAISEVARNIVVRAREGELFLGVVEQSDRRGIAVVAREIVPNISSSESAMRDGHSTAGGVGLDLSSARRLVDEFEVASMAGEGTTVTMKKWIA
jgi:serine/threonine-protein kinase RsbT